MERNSTAQIPLRNNLNLPPETVLQMFRDARVTVHFNGRFPEMCPKLANESVCPLRSERVATVVSFGVDSPTPRPLLGVIITLY